MVTKCNKIFSGDQPHQNGIIVNVSEALSASIIRELCDGCPVCVTYTGSQSPSASGHTGRGMPFLYTNTHTHTHTHTRVDS
jgi:hypothetical protein